MVANIIYSDRLNAPCVKSHLVAFNPGGNYQGNQYFSPTFCAIVTQLVEFLVAIYVCQDNQDDHNKNKKKWLVWFFCYHGTVLTPEIDSGNDRGKVLAPKIDRKVDQYKVVKSKRKVPKRGFFLFN